MMRGEDLTVVLNSARTVLENGARNTFAAPFTWKFAMLPERVSSAVLPSSKVVVYSL